MPEVVDSVVNQLRSLVIRYVHCLDFFRPQKLEEWFAIAVIFGENPFRCRQVHADAELRGCIAQLSGSHPNQAPSDDQHSLERRSTLQTGKKKTHVVSIIGHLLFDTGWSRGLTAFSGCCRVGARKGGFTMVEARFNHSLSRKPTQPTESRPEEASPDRSIFHQEAINPALRHETPRGRPREEGDSSGGRLCGPHRKGAWAFSRVEIGANLQPIP